MLMFCITQMVKSFHSNVCPTWMEQGTQNTSQKIMDKTIIYIYIFFFYHFAI